MLENCLVVKSKSKIVLKIKQIVCQIILPIKSFSGGGLAEEAEFIEVVEMTLAETKEMMDQEQLNSPPEFCFALTWIFLNIFPDS